MSIAAIAKLLIILGIVMIILGGILYIISRYDTNSWKMPGDLQFEVGSFSCLFALGTSLLLSIIFTIILNLALRWINR